MSESRVQVVTLKIDDKDVSAVPIGPFFRLRASTASTSPRMCYLEGLSGWGACRLCLVEIKGTPKLLPACVTQGERRDGGDDAITSTAEVSADDRRDALRRAQSRVQRLRQQRTLRIAGDGAEAGHHPHRSALPLSDCSRSTARTRCSGRMTTAASCARAACACVMRSKVRTRGT